MNKKYFGSIALQNTIQKVKQQYPECIILYEEDPQKAVTFKFHPEERKQYKLTEGKRTYLFLNGHLILSNGPINPFRYDALDALIEQTELQYDIEKQKDSVTKIRFAINNCMDFYQSTIISIGNWSGKTCDLKFSLNEVERAYHLDLDSDDVHMAKIDPEQTLIDVKQYELRDLEPKIVYRILKTTHPGLKTKATEYISGIWADKESWNSVEDAYSKPWKKDVYEAFGISPLDVLADVTESRLVGEYAENPMRRLVLYDGSQYAYREVPLEAISYSEYQKNRNAILQQYKTDVMMVCKEANVLPPKAIESLNIYMGKNQGPVILKPVMEAICDIRVEKLDNPIDGIVSKIKRTIRLYDHSIGFTAHLRKSRVLQDAIKRIDINEDGNVTKVDIDMLHLKVSKPYVISPSRKITIMDNIKRNRLTYLFVNELEKEIKKMGNTPEYKTFQFLMSLKEIVVEGNIVLDDENNVYKVLYLKNNQATLLLNPYQRTLKLSNNAILSQDGQSDYEKVRMVFEKIFG